MPQFIICLTTTNRKSIAEKIAAVLIKTKSAACVNIINNAISVYRWQRKILREKEYLLFIKTRRGKLNNVKKLIAENHNYQLPEFIYWEIKGGQEVFLRWIVKETS